MSNFITSTLKASKNRLDTETSARRCKTSIANASSDFVFRQNREFIYLSVNAICKEAPSFHEHSKSGRSKDTVSAPEQND